MYVPPQAIVECARTWIGTRFHHQGRCKRNATHTGGVDCLGLLIGVARELDLQRDGVALAAFDEAHYSHTPDTLHLRQQLGEALHEVPLDSLAAGQVLLMEIHGSPQHLGIVSTFGEGLGLIHAYAQARGVVEHALDAHWRGRIVAAYRLASPA